MRSRAHDTMTRLFSRDENWSRALASLALALSLIECALAGIFMLAGDPAWGYALVGGLCSALVMTPFLLTRLSVFSLWGPVALVVTVGTGIRGLLMSVRAPDPARVEALFIRGQEFTELVWPAVVTVLSVGMVTAGYIVARKWRWGGVTVPIPRGWTLTATSARVGRIRLVILGYAAAGAFGTAMYLYAVGGLGARINERRTVYESGGAFQSQGHWEFLARAGVVALVLFIAWTLLQRRRLKILDWLLMLALAANAFAINIVTTTRTDILYVTLGALLILHVVRGRVGPSVLVVGSLVVILGIGALSGLRAGSEVSAGFTSGLASGVMNRNGYDLSKTLAVVDAVPDELPHAYGATWARYALAPIPRAVWPEKPAISEGVTVGREVYGLEHTGIPPGVTGELVWNFGRPLAVLLSMLVGLGLGFIERKAFAAPAFSLTHLLIRALVVLPFGKAVMGVSLGQALSAAAQTTLLLIPLLMLAWSGSLQQVLRSPDSSSSSDASAR